MNSIIELMIVLRVLLLFDFILVLERVDLSAESQLPGLLLNLLLLLVTNQILYLLIFIANQPIQFIDFSDEGFDFLDVA